MSWRARTYDELPALSVRGGELRRTLRRIIVAYTFGVAWASLIAGGQMRTYCALLGRKHGDAVRAALRAHYTPLVTVEDYGQFHQPMVISKANSAR